MDSNQAIELLKQLIAIPSLSHEEDQAAHLMEETLQSMGYITSRCGNNVWACSPEYDPDKPTILLDSHIDTVKPNPQWTLDPFTPIVKEGRLYGLGSNDTGGNVVAMLAAFSQLTLREQPYNLIYMASAEEENTGVGGIQSALPMLGKVDLAIVGEPTCMDAAVAEKGLFVVDCTSEGKSGHAAREEGINAIYKALPDIEWFRNYRFEHVSPLLGPVKMTVTGIQAGSLHNVVPAECRFTVDIRVNEYYTNQEIFDTISRNVSCRVVPRSFSLGSSSIDESHPVVQRCKALGMKLYASPTTSNQAVMPFTSIKIGAGDSARSHTADEYIHLDEIAEGIEKFVLLLDGLNLSEQQTAL